MNSNLKKLTALSLAAVLALNLAGRNVYADESIIDESLSEESVNDESNRNETLFESDEEQQKSNDENNSLETEGEIKTNDVEDTQDSIENEGIVDEGVVDKQIITGFADLDESVFTVEEKLPIKELGLPEQLPVYINGSDEVEYIAVTWECADYENTEYESYTFSPVWDVDVFEIDNELDISIPTIMVELNLLVMSVNTINDVEVTTNESSFDFSKGAINGLKDSYIESLSDEQKKHINLVIPDSIAGQKVTAISDYAFYYTFHNNIQECAFNIIDISEATNLISIGSHAFDSVELNQNAVLSLPISNESSMTNIGTYAFNNCKFSGQLVLPASLIKIGDSAFRMSNESVSFTGELVIPENVETIGTVAFSNQAGLETVRFDSKKITEISASLFKYCKGLNGVLVIPSNIKKIGNHAFNGTNYNAIYLPKRSENNDDFVSERTFGEHSDLNILIICDKSDYDYIYGKTHKWLKPNIGYEMTVDFLTDNGSLFEPITRLYNQPFNLEKQSNGQWVVNNKYSFPSISNMMWGLSALESKGVAVTDKVTQDKLYSISAVEYPVFTYSIGIDKEYDGEVSVLRVNASHSKAKQYTGYGKPGDVFFKYWWYWNTFDPIQYEEIGFDINEYKFKDVRGTDGANCTVVVRTYIVNDERKLVKLINDTFHSFTVNLLPAPSIVNPIYSNEQRTIGSGLPDISLSEGDTEGTIKWDDGQTITEGIHDYTWTFTPVKNSVGSSNYTTVTGKASLNFVQGYNVIKGNITNGDIELDKPYGAVPNDDLTITFKSNSGYKLSSALLDNTDIFNQVSDNKYTIRNIQSNHTLDASFTSMETKDVEDVIESLPDIKDVVITEEVKNDILDAKLHYDAVTKDSEDISEDAKEKMYEAISKLDQVETAITPKANVTNNIDVSNEVSLLENMETEDAEALKNSNNASLKIELVVDVAPIDDDKQQVLERVLGDAVVGDSFDVTVIKKLIDNNSVTKETPLKELKKPIQLVFEIPSNLPAIEQGYVREFSIIRLHDVNGQIIPDILKDEDSYEDSISVSSDKFSTYIIIYKDVKKQDSSQGGGSGSYFKTYTIRFETFGGSSIDSVTDVKTGKKINAPTEPKRKGYIFKGWYIDQACTELWDFSKNAVTSNLTLYAGWEKIAEVQTFNLVFDSMGGSFVDEMKGLAAGEIVNVSVTPVKEGYTFNGWYLDKACTIPWDYIVNDNLILYAGWNKNEIERQSFLIVFESNNGDSTLSEYLPAGDKVSMPESPVREGYTFIGWFIDEECTIPWDLDTAVNSNVTLYAGWKEIERQIHLVISEETAEKKIENIKVTEGKKAEMPQEPVKEGYLFKGWFTDKECTIPWDFDTNVVDEDMTLYAGWEKVEEKKETNEQPEKEPTVSKEANNTTVLTVSALAAVTALIACVFVFKRKKANK